MNALLLANGFPIQYRVLRCAAEAGMTVSVLGTVEATGLRTSRYCSSFFAAPTVLPNDDEASREVWQRGIEECIRSREINLVIACDTKSTGLLSALQGRLSVPAYPVPTHADFETLHDKWSFYGLCNELGLQTPQTWLFQDKAQLVNAIHGGQLPDHLIAKPIRWSGNRGIISFQRRNAAAFLPKIDYQPILVQQYIEGETACLSVFADQGEVKIALGYLRRGPDFVFATNEIFLSYAVRITGHLGAHGLLNFDAQITPTGRVYLLECNPRMYLNLDYAALAGMNFVSEGMRDWSAYTGPPRRISDQSIKTPGGLVKLLATPWRIRRADFRMARFRLADPLPQLVELVRLAVARCPPKLTTLILKAFRPLAPNAAKYVGL